MQGEYKVYIYESEYNLIIAEAQKYQNRETGGSLFGTYTHGGMLVVWLASGPGPEASGSRGEFEQDAKFMTRWAQHLMHKYALQYIGSWHSHHTLSIKKPSSGDVRGIQMYAVRHQRNVALEIIVTHDSCDGKNFTTVPRAYFYPDAKQGDYVDAEPKILDGESPVRKHLGDEEKEFSPVTSETRWKNVKREFRSDCNDWASTKVPAGSSARYKQQLSVPLRLTKEVKRLEDDRNVNVSIEPKDSKFMVIAQLPDNCRLTVLFQQDEEALKVLKAEHIDDNNNNKRTNIDVGKGSNRSNHSGILMSLFDEASRLTKRM
jgi:proteasome lid subunit RPN8/RPN11